MDKKEIWFNWLGYTLVNSEEHQSGDGNLWDKKVESLLLYFYWSRVFYLRDYTAILWEGLAIGLAMRLQMGFPVVAAGLITTCDPDNKENHCNYSN